MSISGDYYATPLEDDQIAFMRSVLDDGPQQSQELFVGDLLHRCYVVHLGDFLWDLTADGRAVLARLGERHPTDPEIR